MKKSKRVIKDKLDRVCVVCGKRIKVILYTNRTYRGGHYFGRLSLPEKKNKKTIYRKVEYWECPKCYWNY